MFHVRGCFCIYESHTYGREFKTQRPEVCKPHVNQRHKEEIFSSEGLVPYMLAWDANNTLDFY